MSAKYAGEVIAWAAGAAGTKVPFSKVVKELKANGLDPDVANAIKPRAAFVRIAKEMAKEHLIRVISEDDTSVVFQFTAETKKDKGDDVILDYKYETHVVLNKLTGKVLCKDADIAKEVQKGVDERKELCTALDISGMMQRLFKSKADLFPIRDQGGCYFVPSIHSDFVDAVEKFYTSIGGTVRRFPVPADDKNAKKTVKATIDEGMNEMIAELDACVDKLHKDSRGASADRYSNRIKVLQFKIESYAEYLGDAKNDLKKRLTETKTALMNKMAEID